MRLNACCVVRSTVVNTHADEHPAVRKARIAVAARNAQLLELAKQRYSSEYEVYICDPNTSD